METLNIISYACGCVCQYERSRVFYRSLSYIFFCLKTNVKNHMARYGIKIEIDKRCVGLNPTNAVKNINVNSMNLNRKFNLRNVHSCQSEEWERIQFRINQCNV